MFRGLVNIFIVLVIFQSSLKAASSCHAFYSGNQRIFKIHEEITETLFIGYPVRVKSFSANGNRNPLWLVTLENPKTKKQVKALFKPRNYGDGDGWNRVPMEYVSYGIARLLDLDVIPSVAYRRGITLNGQYFHEGSMQYFVEGATLLKEVDKRNWNLNADNFISNARVLDVLLQNPDRHVGNFIYGSHWVDQVPRPLLIDQAANLRKGTNTRLSDKGPFNDQPINHFDPNTVKKLRELSEKKLNAFREFISKDEIALILRNRDEILKAIDTRSSDK